jgi:DnaJ-class molecular chaperone
MKRRFYVLEEIDCIPCGGTGEQAGVMCAECDGEGTIETTVRLTEALKALGVRPQQSRKEPR